MCMCMPKRVILTLIAAKSSAEMNDLLALMSQFLEPSARARAPTLGKEHFRRDLNPLNPQPLNS